MTDIKPFTPAEAKANKITTIPHEVIEAVNTLLAQRYSSSINIRLIEIVALAREIFARNGMEVLPTSNDFYRQGWLDIEPLYEKAGWKVIFDKPAYNENYESNFTFKPGTK